MSIHICILAGRELVHSNTAMGLASITNGLTKGGVGFAYTIHTATAPIDYIRSEIANGFMHYSEFDWLLFIDDDIGFSGQSLKALFDVGEDLVIGACPFRALQQPRLMCLPVKPTVKNSKNNAIEVLTGGMGFTLIHRRVFEAIKGEFPELEYRPMGNPPGFEDKKCYHYFDILVKDGIARSEDVSFCERYRAAGGKVWLALDTNLSHSGMHTFTFPKPVREII